MRNIIIPKLFVFIFSAVFLFLQGCINMSKQEAADKPVGKQVVDSTANYLIKVNYPAEPQDKEEVMKKWVDLKLSDKKFEWKNLTTPRNEYQINYSVVQSDSSQTVSYLMNEYENTGGASGNQKVTSFSFRNNQLMDIQGILNFSNGNDLQLTKLLAAKAASDTNTFSAAMLNESFGLNFLNKDGLTLDTAKCKCNGFFFGSNLQCYVIRNEGIGFVFGKYVVGPGSSQTPEILLDWKTLAPFIQTGFERIPKK
jgi:hypothetical protein